MRQVQLRRILHRGVSSLWFAPVVAATVAVVSARLLVRVDQRIPQESSAWFLFGGEADAARDLLAAIAGALITLTGLVFSITILVLQLASSQFSPRVLQTFLEDRTTRLSMGMFIGSFVYTIAILPNVRSGTSGGDAFVPALSVFVALLVILGSVFVFIRYIHHMAHSIRAVHVVKRVADETRRSIEELYPETAAREPGALTPVPDPRAARVLGNEGGAGVVSVVDENALLALAYRHDVVIGVVPFPGDFVPRGAPLFRLWGREDVPPRELRQAVTLEEERTPKQDPAFGFRQLVDVAERALSPGVNDPTTAVQAVDQIHDLLRSLARRHFPSPVRVDEAGRPRLVLSRPDWEAFVRLGFDEIRLYGSESVQVTRRLRAALEDLLQVAPPERAPPLHEQLALVERATMRAFEDEGDRRQATSPSPQGQGQERSPMTEARDA